MEQMKQQIKTFKVRYTNWFSLSLWLHIFVVVKQHHSIQSALNYLKAAFWKSRDLSNNYDASSRGSMYECFHPTGKLKDNYKRCVELGNYFIKSKQQYIILTNPLQLKMRFASLKETKRITTTFVWCLLTTASWVYRY
jgi:hypothetical protein